MKSGIGLCAVSVGSLKMAAVVVLNALGDIFNPETGQKIAGLLDPERKHFSDTCEERISLPEKQSLPHPIPPSEQSLPMENSQKPS